MAQLMIRLQVDPKTRKKNIIIGYRSDEDALPLEHEEEHRRLVNQLIEGGAISAAELGQIIIERESEQQTPTSETSVAEQEQHPSIEQKS
jgi:hypothetical protein